jgi:peptide/nickel transport system substrate-binding protein
MFKELPYTAEQAEVNQVRTGPSALTIGYLPVADLPLLSSVTSLGYHPVAAYTFSADYFPLNLNNPKFGPVFRQVYFRQAFQHLVDQSGWIRAFESAGSTSYAIPQYGIIPTTPSNSFLAPDAKTDPAPFSISAASQLLSSHGWKVTPNGTTTCTNPGTGPTQCGAGVPAGLGLSFNLDYQSGVAFLDSEMKTLKSDASQVGIQLQLTTHPFDQVISTAVQCAPTDSTCGWTSENWGGGWVYSPDFYPTGEEVTQTHAAANYSNYSDPKMDSLIAATTTASAANAQSALDTYQDYVRQQLPFVFQPNTSGNPQPGGPNLVSQHLGGFTVNAYSYILPEDYYLTK